MTPDLTHVFPHRMRCAKCRCFFGFEIIDGLYDLYECAGQTPPSQNPDDWPRQHYAIVRGVRRAKQVYILPSDAEIDALREGKKAYWCEYCRYYHIGGNRSVVA